MTNLEKGLRWVGINSSIQHENYICFSFSFFPIFGLNLLVVPRAVQYTWGLHFVLMFSTELWSFGSLEILFCLLKNFWPFNVDSFKSFTSSLIFFLFWDGVSYINVCSLSMIYYSCYCMKLLNYSSLQNYVDIQLSPASQLSSLQNYRVECNWALHPNFLFSSVNWMKNWKKTMITP